MCAINVTKTETQISVSSPYTPKLPARARALGGKWDAGAKVWRFDARLADDVAALYREVYGEWPGEGAEYVTLVAAAPEGWNVLQGGIFIAGRCVARAYGRDSGAKLGEGVILREGGFHSGGSMKNWRTCADEGTVVEIMDVPRPAAEAAIREEPRGWVLTIKAGSETIDRVALEEEKARLLARIAEIDALLGRQ